MGLSSEPALSVVVVILGGGPHLERCLRALRGQKRAPATEVIVPFGDCQMDMTRIRQQNPGVKFLHVPGRPSYARLRAEGLRAALGRIVAITEDQCIPPEGWCANVVAAHASPHAAIGGPVDKQGPDNLLNWAIYLRELGAYMSPLPEGPSAQLTDCNVSYKRGALQAIAPVWADEFHEPEVHRALRQQGESLWLSGALQTFQQRSVRLGPALRERYEFGRLYGSLRVKDISAANRFLLVVGSPLLPFLLLARVMRWVLVKRRHVSVCLAAMPYLLLFSAAWSWGELIGYLTRRGPAIR